MSQPNSNYIVNRAWADQYHNIIKKIVEKIAPRIISFTIAPEQEDMTQATDYIITVEKGTIACRIRRPQYNNYRDFTIRSRNGESKTELAKIKEGFGRWYIYAWTKNESQIAEWWLLDLNALRESPLLNTDRPEKQNTDGKTAFISFTSSELYLWNVLIERGVE